MDRIQKITAHPLWRQAVAEIRALEQDRVFCRHTVEHFVDVARLAYIENLERGLGISKALIYAAALLHDIGRGGQYARGIPHDRAGVELAEKILPQCGFSPEEQGEILLAIGGHRDPETKIRDDLAGLLYRADKASRLCLFCEAEPECNWPEEKKNLKITG